MKNGYDPRKQELLEKAIFLFKEKKLNCKEISKELGIYRKTVSKWLRKKGFDFSKCNKRNLNSFIFSSIDTEEKAYWLGFIYADGYVSDKGNFELTLKLSDSEHLEKFKSFLLYDGKIYKDSYRCRICIQDLKFVECLNNLGVLPRKSLILTFPNETIVSKEFINSFVRGYFDGDGYMGISNRDSKKIPRVGLIGTLDFMTTFMRIFNIDIPLKKHNCPSENVYVTEFSYSKAFNFLDVIYKNPCIYLTRKYEKYLKCKNG